MSYNLYYDFFIFLMIAIIPNHGKINIGKQIAAVNIYPIIDMPQKYFFFYICSFIVYFFSFFVNMEKWLIRGRFHLSSTMKTILNITRLRVP